jgi:cytochrome oxidase Cu insertion factor (SCO1/SenC/PrrC family)
MKHILSFVLFLSLNLTTKAQTPLSVAEDFTVTDLDGNTFNLFNTLNNNKFVVIDFFYCTCVPCQINTPKVQYAYQYFGCNRSNVVFLSMDTGDDTEACRLFEENYQNLAGEKFPSVSGDDGGGNAVCSAYGILAYPTVILIAPDKTILEQDIWPIADGPYLASIIEGHGGIAYDCSAVGIEEVRTAFADSYPNPVSDVFKMKFNVSNNESIAFEVYNILGEKIMNIPENSYSRGSYIVPVPVTNLSDGTYLIKIISEGIPKDMCKMFVVK